MERWRLFLLAALIPLLIGIAISFYVDRQAVLFIALAPATGGVLASLVLHFLTNRSAWSRDSAKLLPLLLLVIPLLIWIGVASGSAMPVFIIVGSALIALVWQAWHWMGDRILAGWAVQVGLLFIGIRVVDVNAAFANIPSGLNHTIGLAAYWLIPETAIVSVACLLHLGQIAAQSKEWRKVGLISLLILSILLPLGYQIFLARIWEVATDGFEATTLWFLVSVAGIAAAMVLAWFLPGKRKLVTLVLAVLLPLSMWGAYRIGATFPDGEWGTSPTFVTERRAERIDRAIQRYHRRTGDYPRALADLVPRDLLYLPNPLIIPGQTWCYEAGADTYRLGYIYRRYFSTPASVRVHAAVGQPPDLEWPCDDEAAKHPGPPGYHNP
jgi:hypothetical protein